MVCSVFPDGRWVKGHRSQESKSSQPFFSSPRAGSILELQTVVAAGITTVSLFLELSCSVNTFRTFVLTGYFLQIFDTHPLRSGFRKTEYFPILAN